MNRNMFPLIVVTLLLVTASVALGVSGTAHMTRMIQWHWNAVHLSLSAPFFFFFFLASSEQDWLTDPRRLLLVPHNSPVRNSCHVG